MVVAILFGLTGSGSAEESLVQLRQAVSASPDSAPAILTSTLRATGKPSPGQAGVMTASAIEALGPAATPKQIAAIVYAAVRAVPDDALQIVRSAVRVSPPEAAPQIAAAAVRAVPNPWREVRYQKLNPRNPEPAAPAAPTPVTLAASKPAGEPDFKSAREPDFKSPLDRSLPAPDSEIDSRARAGRACRCRWRKPSCRPPRIPGRARITPASRRLWTPRSWPTPAPCSPPSAERVQIPAWAWRAIATMPTNRFARSTPPLSGSNERSRDPLDSADQPDSAAGQPVARAGRARINLSRHCGAVADSTD